MKTCLNEQCNFQIFKNGNAICRFRERLQFSPLKLMSVFWVLPDGERSIVWAKVVTKTINNFWASTDAAIEAHHVPTWYRSTSGSMCRPTETQKQVLEAWQENHASSFSEGALNFWRKMNGFGCALKVINLKKRKISAVRQDTDLKLFLRSLFLFGSILS